ncbi:MAG: carbohydrate binding domain-containing protein [Planctomycetota bacterium]
MSENKRKLLGRIWLAPGALCLVFSLQVCAAEAEAETHDINGGFEKTATVTKYEDEYRRWVKDGHDDLPDPVVKAVGWHPQDAGEQKWKMEIVTDEEKAHSGKNFLKLTGGRVYYYNWPYSDVRVKPGDEVTLSMWAKGGEDAGFTVEFYQYGLNKEGKITNLYNVPGAQYMPLTNQSITSEWKEYAAKYPVPSETDRTVEGSTVCRVSPALHRVRGEVCFDDVTLVIKRAPSAAE